MPSLNWLAVLVAAVLTFLLGALWYSPLLFAKQWARAHGYTPEQLENMRKSAGRAYIIAFLCYVVMAAMLAVLAWKAGASTVPGGLRLGFVCWLGFVATVGLTAHLFSAKPRYAVYAIDGSYSLVALLLQGVVLALWQ